MIDTDKETGSNNFRKFRQFKKFVVTVTNIQKKHYYKKKHHGKYLDKWQQ